MQIFLKRMNHLLLYILVDIMIKMQTDFYLQFATNRAYAIFSGRLDIM